MKERKGHREPRSGKSDASPMAQNEQTVSAADHSSARIAFPVVGVGASAGGLEAFTELLRHLPFDTGMAFVLLQHLDPAHASVLREALARTTDMAVRDAEDGTRLEPNHVYVLPPNTDIAILHGLLSMLPRPAHGRKPYLPIDFFFRALAAEHAHRAIGIVLSGTGSDGTEGLGAIKAGDGITLAQDPKSAKFGGMPHRAIEAGVVDYCLSIPEIAGELVRLSRHPYVAEHQTPVAKDDETTIRAILATVRNGVGVDFTEYKLQTIERRLSRRMALRKVENLWAYLTVLQAEPEEVRLLHEDVLIHVTSFFRDPAVFESLEEHVFPDILRHKPEGESIRLWVEGCSTGEEAYSLGIALLDFMGDVHHPIQIFGSDVSEKAIEKARAGLYPDSVMCEVNEERRKRYFTKVDHGYRIIKAVRDLCVFVQGDLTRDPPFSKLDLVSCRNVLIYFSHALQKEVLPTFHYALNEPGFLLLGRAENISRFGSFFSVVDKSNKVFKRTSTPSTLRFAPRPEVPPIRRPSSRRGATEDPVHIVDIAKHLDRLILARYAPAGVLINEGMEILQFRGQIGSYLQPAPGQPQSNLIKMAREGLLSALQTTIARAKKEKAPVRKDRVEVEQGGFTKTCNVVVIPFPRLRGFKEPLYVVMFEEMALARGRGTGGKSKGPRLAETASGGRQLARLKHELAATKEYLRSLIEDHGLATDELGSANEELVSSNEELQRMNEELETAKEELQATNEELTTINDGLHGRTQEANNDLVNLLDVVDIPILILEANRHIRRFTPAARQILNVLPSDLGRPLDDIKSHIAVPDLDQQVAEVVETKVMKESEVLDRDGRWHRMQIRSYTSSDGQTDGAILSLVEIDALKHHISDAQQARADAERANAAKDQFLAILSHELRTPLTAMLLQAQVLQRGQMDSASSRRAIESIEKCIVSQAQLIDDLHDVSSIVMGKMSINFESVDLRAVVKTAIDSFGAAAERKSIDLDVVLDDSIPPLSGDAARLKQVVTNLLANAVKFTPNGGQIKVVLAMAEGQARLTVSDTGIGIEAAFLSHVFNRFAQQDSSNTRAHGGLGLGLAIVRHLVELHGGMVRAESAGTGKGASFSITLPVMAGYRNEDVRGTPFPLKGASSSEDDGALRANHRLRERRILVVDDDPGTRAALAELFHRSGAAVRMAESAKQAILVVQEFKPDVLLCDVAMPGEDGYALIRKVRALGSVQGGDVPALALTALAGDEDRRRALDAGFQVHLAKPIGIDRLLGAVATLACRAPVEGFAGADALPLGASLL